MSSALQRIAGRVRLAIARAVLGVVNDAAKLQAVQVTLRADVVRDDAEHFQHYGFTSVPLPGAEGIALAVGGSTDHLVVLNIDDRRYRKKGLQAGEVCIYTQWGDQILLRENEIQIQHATQVTINAPLVAISGDLTVDGTVVATGHVTGNGTVLGTHTHGGVESGPDSSGPPN